MTDDELRKRLEAHPEQLRTAMRLLAIDLRVLVDYLLDQLPAATLHVRATALVKLAEITEQVHQLVELAGSQ